MKLPRGIALRIALLGWLVTLVTLAAFVMVIVPEQKREFALNLDSKARGVAVSIRSVAAGAAVSEDYSAVVEQAMQVLSGDKAIEYVVITKSDGFSLIIDRTTWKIDSLGDSWRPHTRTPVSSIGGSPLFGRRVYQYAYPFDYSGIPWGWIHVGLSLNTYDGSVRRTYQSTVALAALCGGLSLLVSLVYAARLVRPIRLLHEAVERVAKGDLRAHADIHSRDEIEHLAKAFNKMAQTILARNQILESVSFAAKKFLSDGDFEAIIEAVNTKFGEAAGASRACVLKMNSQSDTLQLLLQREFSTAGSSSEDGWGCFSWKAPAAAAWVALLKEGHAVTLLPARLDKRQRDLVDPRIRSSILVPVVVAGNWWGVLIFDDFLQERKWGDAEKDSLRAVADMLGASIARYRVRTALLEAKETLEQRVVERTSELQEEIEAKDRAHKELAAAQRRLIELSREAGMAEIATGVLHNVGNVLNSVNVSTSLVAGKVRESRVNNLVAVIQMLEQHAGDLPEFLTKDPKGQRVMPYLTQLGAHFQSERDRILTELESLSSHVGHIKQIVATQQNYAKVSGLIENIDLASVVDDAIRIMASGLIRHGIAVEREVEPLGIVAADKHQILQILLNLLRNAKEAINGGDSQQRVIRVSVRRQGGNRIHLAIHDTGVGLAPENLTRIFAHGFTTKSDGHGFGLHSCALAASTMGGSLRAESEGLGHGATFILDLPLKKNEYAEDPKETVCYEVHQRA